MYIVFRGSDVLKGCFKGNRMEIIGCACIVCDFFTFSWKNDILGILATFEEFITSKTGDVKLRE